MSLKSIKLLMLVSGIYDGILGLAFALGAVTLFRVFGVTLPNHLGYIRFPGLVLLIFAAMFFRIAADPVKRREQLAYGMALKASYVALVAWYWVRGDMPAMWIPLAWIDAAFLVLYVFAWRALIAAAATASLRESEQRAVYKS